MHIEVKVWASGVDEGYWNALAELRVLYENLEEVSPCLGTFIQMALLSKVFLYTWKSGLKMHVLNDLAHGPHRGFLLSHLTLRLRQVLLCRRSVGNSADIQVSVPTCL